MDQFELMVKLENIIEKAKAGVLAIPDKDGNPSMRWLSPTLLKNIPFTLYAVTSPQFDWVQAMAEHPYVEWMIQPPALNEIIRLRGELTIIDNPSLKSEVLQAIGKRLTTFWHVNLEQNDFVVLETKLREGFYHLPMKGEKTTFEFKDK